MWRRSEAPSDPRSSEKVGRNVALIIVSVLRYLDGTWSMDLFREKRIRRALDEISHLHGLPILGQLPPAFLTVRIYRRKEEPINFAVNPPADLDLHVIARDLHL
jgi:hypothetical protein